MISRTSYSGKPGFVTHTPEYVHAGLRPTRAVKLDLTSLMTACYRIKCFPGARRLILVIGLIEIRARLYVTCWELKLEVNYM